MKKLNEINQTYFSYLKKSFIIGAVFTLGGLSPLSAASKKKIFITADTLAKTPSISFSDADLLSNSQIAYRAEGGFTGIRSYSVIVSCVKGRISVLKSIHDPQRSAQTSYQKGSLDKGSYLQLWRDLKRQKVFSTASLPEPKLDIADELTLTFEARVGSKTNSFSVHGIHRPEACQQFAIKSLIDHSTQMQSFMGTRETLAQR